MPTLDSKVSLLNELSAIKSLNSIFPNLGLNFSLPSINTKNNVFDFLLDLLQTLVGGDQIKGVLIDLLSFESENIEAKIKEALLLLVRQLFFCDKNPVIPDILIDGVGSGFNVMLKQIDFFEILKIDPSSDEGKLVYGLNSDDLNIFIFDVIQNGQGVWKDLIVVDFLPQGVVAGFLKPNVLSVRIHSSWQGKTLAEFISALFNEVDLFSLHQLINQVFDYVFGIVSSFSGKGSTSVLNNEVLYGLVEKVINLPEIEIDDSYFDFNVKDLSSIMSAASLAKTGVTISNQCEPIPSFVSVEQLILLSEELFAAPSKIEIKKTIDRSFTILAQGANQDGSPINEPSANVSLFSKMFKGLLNALIANTLSPKLMLVFSIYFNAFGQVMKHLTFDDFLSSNKQLIIKIIRESVLPIIIDYLLKIVVKEVKKLVVQDQVNRNLESVKNYQLQMASLVGIPQNIRDLIAQTAF